MGITSSTGLRGAMRKAATTKPPTSSAGLRTAMRKAAAPAPATPPPPPRGTGSTVDFDYSTFFTGGEDLSEFAQIPRGYKIYRVDGQLYMVWDVPVNEGGDVIPIAYTVTDAQLADFGNTVGITDISMADWTGAGTVEVGDFTELDNADEHPLQFFFTHIEEQSILFPWLLDPEIMGLSAAAHLEGRSLDEAELAGTNWWQTHNSDERQWLIIASSDPTSAARLREDNRIAVLELLMQAGITNADDLTITVGGSEIGLADWLADQRTVGTWTDTYLTNQITILGDPTREDEIDQTLGGLLAGISGDLNTNQGRMARVRELYHQWLGPALGNPTNEVVEEWASRLRRSASAEEELLEMLKDQRIAAMPEYQDRETSYQAIAGPWRNLMSQTWGEQPDEADPFFLEMVRKNDAIEAGKMLRQEGLRRGNQSVTAQAFTDMFNGFGGEIVRMA